MELLEDLNRDYQRYRFTPRERAFLGLQGLQPVLSSNVAAVGVRNTELLIRFHNGSVYSYRGKADQYENILKSNSKGKWVWRNLRRKNAPYEKIGVIPLPDDIGVTDEDIFQEIDNRYLADLTRHVDVPVFQSFTFINGINMQKIVVGNINVYKPITEALEVGARVLPKTDIEFKPAETIQEANEYAKKFAEYPDIDLLDVDKANTINRTMETVQQKFPLGRKLIKMKADNLSKGTFASATYENIKFDIKATNGQQFYGKLNVSKQYKKRNENIQWSIDLSDKYIQAELDKDNPDQYTIEYYEKLKKKNLKKIGYSRWSTSTDSDTQDEALAKTTIHEYGHVIDFNFLNIQSGDNTFDQQIYKLPEALDRQKFILERIKLVERFEKLKKQSVKSGQIKQISEYAASNKYETFAESFTMYNTNEQDKLPDGFKEYFDDLEVFVKKVGAL
jgi:hypothetical protein